MYGVGNIKCRMCQQITLHTFGHKERVGYRKKEHPPLREMGALALIHHFAISPQTYCLLGKQNLFPEVIGCPHPGCPFRGRLRKHGFYTRWAILLTGAQLAWIQRYLCPHCRHTTSVLPSFLAPHFQYALIVLVWVLACIHRLGLSTRAVVRHWPQPSQPLSRQSIQLMRRRLKVKANLCQPFLDNAESTDLRIEELLLDNIPRFRGIHRFAVAFFMEWRQPFLSHD